ncbi:MAG: ATP-grasp domain-containing protein [Coriobacteriales bacterium]|jgi:D-aspartate ligase|nr:ATP-grasp domain-containing protein [Coriobacteriales bacterium]
MQHEVGNGDFIPLLFASDINVYSMARAFHEEYGVRSVSYGMVDSGPCVDSRILEHRMRARVDQPEEMLEAICEFAADYPERKTIVVPCGDAYVLTLAGIRAELPANVVAPGIGLELVQRLTDKQRFYQLCDEVGLEYPGTYVYRPQGAVGWLPPCHLEEVEQARATATQAAARSAAEQLDEVPFPLPWVIKPADGVAYWAHPFAGQDKVFIAATREAAAEVIGRIDASGYPGTTIIQDFIPGDDSYMRVLTSYSTLDGQVRLTCLGHVLLEEHTPKGKGNHAVILTGPGEQDLELEGRIQALLEKLDYTGFANFDLKFDSRDGKFKVFECNVRQGRSNFYVTAAGANLARYLVEDLVYGRGEALGYTSVATESLWLVVPEKVAFDYISPPECRQQMRQLIAAGKCTNPLLYAADKSLKHKLRVEKSLRTQPDKFARFYGEHRYAGND